MVLTFMGNNDFVFDVTKQKMLDYSQTQCKQSLVSTSKIYYKELKFGIKKKNIFAFNNSLE